MTTNPPNPNQPNQPNPEVLAQTREANGSVGDVRRKNKRLKDLADTGQHDQGGYLSRKQVTLFTRLTREIEEIYRNHYAKLQQFEDDNERKMKQKYGKSLQELKQDVQKRQQLYDNANGGNRWGNVASPKVRQYHEDKLKEAVDNLGDATKMDKDLDGLRDAVRRLEEQRNQGSGDTNRINDLRTRAYSSGRIASGAAAVGMASFGIGRGLWGYMHYANPDLLRRQERLSNGVSQKLSEYSGVQAHDADFRERMQTVSEKNNYGLLDAGYTANILGQGGIGKGKNILTDLDQVQGTSRAYGLDANTVAGDFASLRKMGTLGEGEMNRFANLIGGAVAKNGMRGREAEMMQASMSLLQSVVRGLPSLSEKGMSNVVSMQTALGQAVPSLKGDRGAQVLSNWDSAIKGGDQGFDLLMGKGFKYTGISGMHQLEKMKEQGLSNPNTAKQFFEGLDRMFGDNDDMKGFAYKQMGFGTITEYDALKKSGFIDQIKQGKMPTASQLKKIGLKDLAKQTEQYNKSETKRVDYQDSRKENQQADHEKLYDEIGKRVNKAWFDIPEEIRHPLIAAGMVGGGSLAYKGVKSLASRFLSPRIGGGGGIPRTLSGVRSSLMEVGSKAVGPAASLAAMYGIESGADELGNWMFGHKKGQNIHQDMSIHNLVDNIRGKDHEQYTDNKKGAIEKFWDWITGSDDKKSGQSTASGSGVNAQKAQKTMQDIANKDYALASALNNMKSDHTIKITIDGKIDGMSKANEDDVKDSISNYFNSYGSAYNLAFDQRRG